MNPSRPLAPLAAALAVLVLAGCASNRYCLEPQDYQDAETYPPISASGDLALPESPSALRIPAAPANPVPFGFEDESGDVVCLDQPPRLAVTFVDPEDPEGKSSDEAGASDEAQADEDG